MKHPVIFLLTVLVTVVVLAPANLVAAPPSAEQLTPSVQDAHYGFSGVITKIRSGMLFVKTETGLRSRYISPAKADRVGLQNAKVGDSVNILVDSSNVLIDVARTDQSFPDHQFIAGRLSYVDPPYWEEIQLATSEGPKQFEVDTLAGSKLSALQEDTPVTVELDADNVMVDIHR